MPRDMEKRRLWRQAYTKKYRAEVRAEGGERYRTQMKASDAWNKRINAAGGEELSRVRALRAQWQRDYRLKNPKETMVNSAKFRAKRDNLPCDITVDTLDWPTHCPILGIELDYNLTVPGERKSRSNFPTLDRRTNDLGYIKGNVFVISHRANRIKSDATADELEAVARYARHGLSP